MAGKLKKSGAPKGSHINKAGKTVQNRGHRAAMGMGAPNHMQPPKSFGLPVTGAGSGGAHRNKQRTGAPAPDYFAQFNAWTDPNIGGQQPGPIQAGYGGFDSLDTMGRTKMNDWLNTLPVGGQRELAMNSLGYNNGGVSFDPSTIAHGTNQFYRQNARQNAQTGAMSVPGIYQHQDANGNYVGFTNVADNGSASYSPLYGRTRRRGTTGVGIY